MFDKTAKLEKAYRRYPRAPLFARLADACLLHGKTGRALALCEEGCKSFPDYPTGYFVLSRCLEARDQLEEAREAMDKGLRLDPRCPAPFRQLSHLYTRMGNATLARKCLEVAARLDPFSESLAQELAMLAPVPAVADPVDDGTDGEGIIAAPTPEIEPAPRVDPAPRIDPAPRPERGEAMPESPELETSEPEIPAPAFERAEDEVREPFARLEATLDWDDAAPLVDAAADLVVDFDMGPSADAGMAHPAPAGPLPAAGQDEVAALGAELADLFGDTSAAPSGPGDPRPEDDVGRAPTEVAPTPPVSVGEIAGAGAAPGAEQTAEVPGLDVESAPAAAAAPLAPQPSAAGPPLRGAARRGAAVARFGNGDGELTALMDDLSAEAPATETAEPAQAGSEPVPPVPTSTLARLYAEQGFTDLAAGIYRQVLRERPGDQQIHAALAALESQ